VHCTKITKGGYSKELLAVSWDCWAAAEAAVAAAALTDWRAASTSRTRCRLRNNSRSRASICSDG